MPITIPCDVGSPDQWWKVIDQNDHYLGLEHKDPSIWIGNPFRILIKKGNNLIASASSNEEFLEDWTLILFLTNEEMKKVGSTTLTHQYLLNFWTYKCDNNLKKRDTIIEKNVS